MAGNKTPVGGKRGEDGSRSPYQDSPQQGRTVVPPKAEGFYKGRGGYPPKGDCKSGGYKK